MSIELLEKLGKPFPREAIRQREGGRGKMLDYIETHTVIRRLNTATMGQWSMSVLRTWMEGDVLMAQVELAIPGLGSRQHIGVQKISDRGGEDLAKGAVSDALKKAATLFGVGLELYGKDYESGEQGYAPESVPTVSRGFRPAPESRTSPMTRDSAEVCNGCGAKLEIAVLRYSKDKFNEPLCRDCQRKRLDAGETGYTRNQPLPPEPPANDEYDHDGSDLSDPFAEGALMDVAPVAPVTVPGADERGRGRATR